MLAALILNHLNFEYPNGRSIFVDLSLSIESGITALVGPNGVGKSTLAKVLTGELTATAGTLYRREDVSYLPQVETPPDSSVLDYLAVHDPEGRFYSEMPGKWLDGIDLGSSCLALSGGQWMRVRLAAHWARGFLILDEPSNDLDHEARTELMHLLKNHRRGILLISHDRELLSLCDQVIEFSNQGVAKFGGSWAEYQKHRSHERSRLEDQLKSAKQDRDRVEEDRRGAIDRQEKRNRRGETVAARGGIPKIILGGMKRRAQATTGRVDRETKESAEEAVTKAYEAYSSLKLDPVMYAKIIDVKPIAGKTIARATDFNIRFGSWLYARDLSFVLRGDSRVVVRGRNGSGKSTLFRCLMGEKVNRCGGPLAEYEQRGEIECANVPTLYLDQKLERLKVEYSILEYLKESAPVSEAEIRNELAMFLFHGEQVHQKIGSLSGGERLRVALAHGFIGRDPPGLIILDEPTNNLDLFNMEFLENLIRVYRGAVLIASHDGVFLENTGMKDVLELSKG